MWPVVKEFCDHACNEVILVRCMATGLILAFCRGCGAAWLDPEDLEDDDFAIGSELFSQGVEVPSREDVARSSWADLVLGYIPEAKYSTASEINGYLAGERSRAAHRPALQQPRAPETPSCSRWSLGVAEGLAAWLMRIAGGVRSPGGSDIMEKLRRVREAAGNHPPVTPAMTTPGGAERTQAPSNDVGQG